MKFDRGDEVPTVRDPPVLSCAFLISLLLDAVVISTYRRRELERERDH